MSGNDSKFRRVRPRTLRQEVADILREAMLCGQFQPGQRLVEGTLAQEMGVGRVPVREALSQLEQQGLISALPNKGARIIAPTPEEMQQATDLRAQLEMLAARLAATQPDPEKLQAMADVVDRMATLAADGDNSSPEVWRQVWELDREFHRRLIDASGNTVLSHMWRMVSPYLLVITVLGLKRVNAWPPVSGGPNLNQEVRNHEELIEAIRSGDVGSAELAAHCHSLSSLSSMKAHLSREAV